MTAILLQVSAWLAVPELLGTFLAWLLRANLQAGVLIVLVLTLQWLLRNRLAPRWRHALWLLPAARLLLPWTPPSPTSIYNFLPMPALAARPVATEPPEAPADITTAPGVAATIPQDSASLRQPMADLGDSAVAAARGRPTGRAYLVAAWRLVPWVWLAGALSVMVLVIAQSVSLRGIRHRRLLTDQRTLELLEDCKQQMGVDTYLAVVETRRVANPALFGFVRPRLLLPAGAVTSLGPARLRHVFLHELAHLRRHDIAINWLMTLLQVLHWFNPLVWYAFARMREERELACDALALSGARPEDPREYGRTLLHLLETGSLARRLPSLAGILESGSVIRRRINMIARFREQQTRGGAALATGLMLVLACVALAGPIATRPTSRAKAELMGRVEDFFSHNFRDITWRKSLEWGDVQTHDDGSRSIRYTYEARIWDRETLNMSQEFTFAQDGSFVRYKDVDGFPRKKERKIADVSTQKGMIALVEGFFSENFRDITARDTIEWGPVSKDEKGNSSIRYKYVATIWGKDKKVIEQIFTFDPSGKFVSVTDTKEEAAKPLILSHVDQTAEDKRSIARLKQGDNGGSEQSPADGGEDRAASAGPTPANDAVRRALRTQFELRQRKDLQKYTREQLAEAEQLYQVANKNPGSPEAKESLAKMIEKYPDLNRTGCAVQYMAQWAKGDERIQLLQQAIEKHGDCMYGDGVQVGAYARFYLAEIHDEAGQRDKSRALYDEIRRLYPHAVNHRGIPLAQLIEASHPTTRPAASGKPVVLSHVDQTAEDKRSIAGSGHAVLFERPDEADRVVAVEIFGARYGSPQPPQENFSVYLLGEDRQVIANVPVPYGRIDRGDMRWRLLPMPGVKVPRKFYVALTFNPERTKGVYVGMDRNVKESHSYVGLPQEKLVPVDDRFDWMVRVHLAPAQERTAAAEQGLM